MSKSPATNLTDTEHEALGAAFWKSRKHRIAGAYLPVGQMDGDCRECGEAWPCSTVLPLFEALIADRVAKARRDTAEQIAVAIERTICHGCSGSNTFIHLSCMTIADAARIARDRPRCMGQSYPHREGGVMECDGCDLDPWAPPVHYGSCPLAPENLLTFAAEMLAIVDQHLPGLGVE